MTQRPRACSTASVPVLLITGPVGVGKSTVGREVFRLLGEEQRVPCAFVDLPALGAAWPPPSDDPWNDRLAHANLACAWENFKRTGARRLVLCRVLEARSLLRHVRAAVPGAEVVVVGLRAPLDLIHERVRSREAADPSWYLDAATKLVNKLRTSDVEDHLVDNDHRSPTDVACEVLRITGWLAD